MAVLPVFTAWTLNLALAYDVALAGMYLFLRRQSISTDGGHLRGGHLRLRRLHDGPDRAHRPDRGGGLAAVDAGGRPRPDRATGPGSGSRRRSGPAHRRAARMWVALLAVSLGLSLLTGSAEAIIDASVLVAIYAVGRLVTMGYLAKANARALATSLLAIVAGVAGGLALGRRPVAARASQFLSQSQRAAATYGFFTSGSLPGAAGDPGRLPVRPRDQPGRPGLRRRSTTSRR